MVNMLIMEFGISFFHYKFEGGGGGGYQNSPKDKSYSNKAKMTSKLLFTGNWI